MKRHRFVRRQAQKKKSFKTHPERIAELKRQYRTAGQPVVSVDTKKKELLGNFYRNGKLYTRQTIAVLGHEFPSYSDGKIVPHGVYDIALSKAHVNLGTSRDTIEFACDSLAHWWQQQGRHDHPQAKQLLMLCDGAGSNPAQSALFRQDLQTLSNRTELEIRVARLTALLFQAQPDRAPSLPARHARLRGRGLHQCALVKQLIERTTTRTGLRVSVDIIDKVYEVGRKASEHLKSSLQIVADAVLPKWNYVVSPNRSP